MTALRLLASIVLLVAAAVPASAQGPGGLFAGDGGKPSRHKLDLTVSAVGANDSDTPPELQGIVGTDSQIGGVSTMLLGNTEYRYEGSRVQVGASGNSSFRHYAELQDVQATAYSAGVGASARLDSRTSILANQSVAYSPSYLYGLFPDTQPVAPGDAVAVAPDYVVDNSESYNYGTNVSLERGLSRRSRLTISADYNYTNFVNETDLRTDLDAKGVRGSYARNVSKNVTMDVGYRYRTGTFAYGSSAIGADLGARSAEHGVDVGVQYLRPLSATRQFTLDASVGSTTVSTPLGIGDMREDARFVGVSGSIGLGYQFAADWDVRGTFRRGVEYVATLGEPVFANGLSLELTGLLTSRLQVVTAARYSDGSSVLNPQDLLLDTRTVETRLQYAASRSVAAYVQYLYYYYSFDQPRSPVSGLPGALERNGVRAGVTLWVPAFRR